MDFLRTPSLALGLALTVTVGHAQRAPVGRPVAIFTVGSVATVIRDSVAAEFERAIWLAAPELREQLTSARDVSQALQDHQLLPEGGDSLSMSETRAVGQRLRARIVGQLIAERTAQHVHLRLQLLSVVELSRPPVNLAAYSATIGDAATALANAAARTLTAELSRTPR